MKISIIIPIYNAASTLDDTIKSIVNQNFDDWELILVDDGSSDTSLAIATEWSTKDTRIHTFSQKNAGPGATRNKGIDEANGEYIIFVDADDNLDKDYLSTIAKPEYDTFGAVMWGITREYKSTRTNIAENSFNTTAPEEEVYTGHKEIRDAVEQLMRKGMYGFSVVMRFRRDILNEYKIRMATDIKLHEDAIFTNQYMQHVSSFKTIPYAGYHYIIDSVSLCQRQHIPSDEMFKIAQHLYNSIDQTIDDTLMHTMIEMYLSKLTLSAKDMFNPLDNPKKTSIEKRERITTVKQEVTKWYAIIPHKTTYRIFRWLPICIIEMILQHNG